MQQAEGIVKSYSCYPTLNLEVKMFIHQDLAEAEKQISLWLQKNPAHVQHITQSQSEKGGSFVFVLSIFYYRLEE